MWKALLNCDFFQTISWKCSTQCTRLHSIGGGQGEGYLTVIYQGGRGDDGPKILFYKAAPLFKIIVGIPICIIS